MNIVHYLLLCSALTGLLACQKPADAVNPGTPAASDSLRATPTAIGLPIGPPATKTIGPAGGTLTTTDGRLSLNFPVGALKQETTISVQPVENKCVNGVGIALQLSPANLAFEQPVVITYYYRDEEMNGSAIDAIGLAYQDGRKAWQQTQFATVDKVKKSVTAKIRLNRLWALMTSYKLEPEQDTVVVSDSRLLTLTKTGGDPDKFDIVVPLVAQVATNDVGKVYINGVDWTSSTPKDQRWGAVGYNPQTAQLLYVAPSSEPRPNHATVTVELKKSISSAQILLSGQITIIADNSLLINGHAYNGVTVNGSLVNGHLIAVAAGTDSTGANGSLSLQLSSLSVGAHPFVNELDQSSETSVNVLNGAGQGDNIEGTSSYSTCLVPKAESGAIQVVKTERSNGTTKVTLQISGRVVTKHTFKSESCTVIEHKTMSVSARLTIVARG